MPGLYRSTYPALTHFGESLMILEVMDLSKPGKAKMGVRNGGSGVGRNYG